MKNNIANILVLIAFVFIFSLPVSAQTITGIPSKEKFRDLKNDLRQTKNEVKQEVREIQKTIKKRVGKIVNGQVSAINGAILTVTYDGKTYTVTTDSNTQFRRHFWGKSSLAEISVGDKVNIYGRFINEAESAILAKLIRNNSIQKRFGVSFGDVISKSTDSFIVKSAKRGDQTVMISTTTKFVARDETVLTFADIQVGHRVRIKGVWDKTLSKITEVTGVKDFTLPLRLASPGAKTSE